MVKSILLSSVFKTQSVFVRLIVGMTESLESKENLWVEVTVMFFRYELH